MVLVIRANNTQRLLDGQKVDPGHCLFINPEIPILEDALADMSRAEWTDENGQVSGNQATSFAGWTAAAFARYIRCRAISLRL